MSKKARVMTATRLLQAKVGSGLVNKDKVDEAQKVLEEHGVDFAPMAEKYLADLKDAIDEVSSADQDKSRADLDKLTEPVMELKANASMFDYGLAGALANTMLNFLETIEELDDNVIEIVDAHHKTMSLIVKNNMKGEGGEYGEEIKKELHDACKRYFAKQSSSSVNTTEDAFFID